MRRRDPSSSASGANGQRRGLVLLVVLVVLTLLLLAGVAAMRSIDTGNVIAGNFSFQQAATQAADRALTDALNTAAAAVAAGAGNTAVPNRYLTTRQTPTDARGFPSGIDWSAVACTDPAGAAVADCDADTGNYRIQYVIERMCASNPDLTDINDIRAKCEFEASSAAVTAASTSMRYRVMMRVRGPRSTELWFEAMVSGPASS